MKDLHDLRSATRKCELKPTPQIETLKWERKRCRKLKQKLKRKKEKCRCQKQMIYQAQMECKDMAFRARLDGKFAAVNFLRGGADE